jgi:hypothetical protein
MPESFNPARKAGGIPMNIGNLRKAVMVGALLTLSCADDLSAGGKLPFTHASSGAIVSIDATKLVVTHQKNGKPETLNFLLTPDTFRTGDLAVGSVVSIHYRMEKNQRLATSIQAQRAKLTARAPN